MGKALLTLLGLVLAANSALAAATPSRKTLSGAEIRKAFIGKTATDGHHWTYHLTPDGSVDAVEMGRSKKGSWAIRGNRLCLSVPAGAPDDCWEVVREGKGLIFRANGMDMTDVMIESGHSKHLSK